MLPDHGASFAVRSALPADMRAVRRLVEPYAERRILLAKEMVGYYEAVQEFLVAADVDGGVVGCPSNVERVVLDERHP